MAKYLDLQGLQQYDNKIKEHIDGRIKDKGCLNLTSYQSHKSYIIFRVDDAMLDWPIELCLYDNDVSKRIVTHTYSEVGDYIITISGTNPHYIDWGDGSALTERQSEFQGLGYTVGPDGLPEHQEHFGDAPSILEVYYGSNLGFNSGYHANCVELSCVKYPQNSSRIGSFVNCHSLKELQLGDTISGITGTFSGAQKISRINFGRFSNISSIPCGMFCGCYSLIDIDIPNAVTSIGNDAFSECESLKEISIPTVTQIDDYAFYDCKSLCKLTISKDVSLLGDNIFSNVILSDLIIKGSPTETEINSLVTALQNSGIEFYSNYRLLY